MNARYFATHRVFTGKPVSRGYVYDRTIGKPIWACDHRHRRWARAQACAEKMLRSLVIEVAKERKTPQQDQAAEVLHG